MEVTIADVGDEARWLSLAAQVSGLFGLKLDEDASFLSSLREHLRSGRALCVKEGDASSGNILGGLLYSKEDGRYEIDWLAVDERARGQGIGRCLAARLESLIVPPASLKVWTFAQGDTGYEAAWRFYRGFGMSSSRVVEGNFPHGNRVQEFMKYYPMIAGGVYMDRKQKALDLFSKDGINCCQAVVGAFDDVVGLDRETLLRLGAAFGGGVCRRGEVCGAVSGLAMIAGLLKGGYDPDDRGAKEGFYAEVDKFIDRFESEHGSILCRELLEKAEKAGAPNHSGCAGFVSDAVELAQKML